jgi:Domain of unknown function (DUF4157)
MSSNREPRSTQETAEPSTIYRDAAAGGSVSGATSAVDAALGQRGSGAAHDSGATFHNDATSHAAASALGANAFTAGSDVYFGAGQYAPGTEGGQALINHELAHVSQGKGVAAPEPGNFRVSSPTDSAEVEAKGGEGGGGATAAPATIHRDVTGGPAPAAGGTGPAGGGASTTGGSASAGGTGEHAAGGPAASGTTDPYEAFKQAVTARSRADADTKWSALKTEDKAKVGTEAADFHRTVIYTLHKDAPKVLAGGNVTIDPYIYTIFHDAEFAQWLPEMRAASLLMPFLAAEPRKGLVSRTEATKLKGWMDATSTLIEAKAIFHKVYPTLLDTATLSAANIAKGIATTAWTQPHITRLYELLVGFVPVGHVQTIQGFFLTTGAGYGWWQTRTFLVALPTNTTASTPSPTGGSDGSVTGGSEGMGHGMTGGNNSGSNSTAAHGGGNKYTAPGGAAGAGANAQMGHYSTSVLHEVGHGVGQRMGGNTYAESSGSWPGWTALGAASWASELWAAPTGTGDQTVHENARKIDSEHARAFMITEIQNGKNSYTYDPGWFSDNPPRNDVAKWLHTRYSNVPLQKWWHYLVEQGNKQDPSYKWSDTSARVVGDWCYGVFTRADQPFSKFKAEAYNKKVSWYGLSSPVEWWAEQYAHYYRTEKTGGGLIDDTTKGMLDRLDNQAWSPTAADGSTGVQYPTSLNSGEGGGGGGGGGEGIGAQPTEATAPGGGEGAAGAPRDDAADEQPLFFPW